MSETSFLCNIELFHMEKGNIPLLEEKRDHSISFSVLQAQFQHSLCGPVY